MSYKLVLALQPPKLNGSNCAAIPFFNNERFNRTKWGVNQEWKRICFTGDRSIGWYLFKIQNRILCPTLGTLQVNVLLVNGIGSFVLRIFPIITLAWNLESKYSILVAVVFAVLTTMSHSRWKQPDVGRKKHWEYVGIV